MAQRGPHAGTPRPRRGKQEEKGWGAMLSNTNFCGFSKISTEGCPCGAVGGTEGPLVQAGLDPSAPAVTPRSLARGTSQPSTHPADSPIPTRPAPDPLHTTEASRGLPAVPGAPSTAGGIPPGRQGLPAAGVPRHSFSSCARSSGRELKAMRQRGQAKPPMPGVWHPRKHSGVGVTWGCHPAGGEGWDACTDLLGCGCRV